MPNGNQLIPGPSGNLGQVQSQLQSLFQAIEGTYNKIKEAGKSQAAFQLRAAAERYARSGRALGVNAFARARALEDLKTQIVTAAREAGAKEEAQKLSAQLTTLNQIGATNAQAFNQAMTQAQFQAAQESTLWQQSFAQQELTQQAEQFQAGLGQQAAMQQEQLGQTEAMFARELAQRQQEQTFAQQQELAAAGGTAKGGTSLRSRFANLAAAGGAGGLPDWMAQGQAPGSTASAVQAFARRYGRMPNPTETLAIGQGVPPEFAGKVHFRDPRTGARTLQRPGALHGGVTPVGMQRGGGRAATPSF